MRRAGRHAATRAWAGFAPDGIARSTVVQLPAAHVANGRNSFIFARAERKICVCREVVVLGSGKARRRKRNRAKTGSGDLQAWPEEKPKKIQLKKDGVLLHFFSLPAFQPTA